MSFSAGFGYGRLDYYPFGMIMPGRKFTAPNSGYRYGFNGKELDKETTATSTYDYGFRIYSPALGRFLSVDPLAQSYPWYTPYQFAGNKPIIAIDLDGLEEKIVINSTVSKTKPATQTQSAIGLADETAAHQNAINGIINMLFLESLKNPQAPKCVLEYGTMGELTVNEKREIIENTVREFTICIATSTNTTPNFNPNVVTESYTVTYDFNYTLLGNKEKIDDIKSVVKSATTVIEYASKVREMTGKLPKVLDKISGPSSVVAKTLEGDGWGVANEITKMLVAKGLTELAKKAPSLAPIIGVAKSNPVMLTIQFTFMNSAPANNNSEIKEKRTEELKMKVIGALLYLFENNNKQYKVEGQDPSLAPTNASDHPEDVQWKQNIEVPHQ